MKLRGKMMITAVLKKTKATMFKDVIVGDILHFHMTLKGPGRGGNGIYAKYVGIKNLRTSETSWETLNALDSRLECFEYEELV